MHFELLKLSIDSEVVYTKSILVEQTTPSDLLIQDTRTDMAHPAVSIRGISAKELQDNGGLDWRNSQFKLY